MNYHIEDFKQLYKVLRKHALTQLPEYVDDLVQESAIKILRVREKMPNGYSSQYVQAVVRNAAYDILRKRKHRPNNVSLEISGAEAWADVSGARMPLELATYLPEFDISQEDIVNLIQKAGLSKAQWQALYMTAMDLSPKQIASQLGISLSTVKTRIFYARKKLAAVRENHDEK